MVRLSVLSTAFVMTILPVPTLTDSLKFSTIFPSNINPVALSLGVDEDNVGAIISSASVGVVPAPPVLPAASV